MLYHSNSKLITFGEATAIDLPEATKSYQPVSNRYLINAVTDSIEGHGLILDTMELACSTDGQKLFGCAKIKHENEELAPAICFRNSYDKSMSVGLASGAKVFVCDNLQIQGSSFTKLRKHTTNVMDDVEWLVKEAVASIVPDFEKELQTIEDMEFRYITLEQGYQFLGLLRGLDILNSKCFNIALKEWKKPQHECFPSNNLWSLYNACTEGLKGSNAAYALQAMVKFDRVFKKDILRLKVA
tara:strand:- start:396 stop:1121 length:726 start_codon:yes stop_codon:yes gene_type:complete